MKDDSFSHPSRRRVLQGVAAFGALGAPAVLRFARAQSKRIVVRDDGGIYTKAYGAVYYRPFTEKTGIEVVGVQANAEPVAQIKPLVGVMARARSRAAATLGVSSVGMA